MRCSNLPGRRWKETAWQQTRQRKAMDLLTPVRPWEVRGLRLLASTGVADVPRAAVVPAGRRHNVVQYPGSAAGDLGGDGIGDDAELPHGGLWDRRRAGRA